MNTKLLRKLRNDFRMVQILDGNWILQQKTEGDIWINKTNPIRIHDCLKFIHHYMNNRLNKIKKYHIKLDLHFYKKIIKF